MIPRKIKIQASDTDQSCPNSSNFLEHCTATSLKLLCKQVLPKTNNIAIPIIPFTQQLSFVILLILLCSWFVGGLAALWVVLSCAAMVNHIH